MFFDNALRMGPKGKIVAEVVVVSISPHNRVLPRAFSLMKPCSKNVTEYNAFAHLASSSLGKWEYNILKSMVTSS